LLNRLHAYFLQDYTELDLQEIAKQALPDYTDNLIKALVKSYLSLTKSFPHSVNARRFFENIKKCKEEKGFYQELFFECAVATNDHVFIEKRLSTGHSPFILKDLLIKALQYSSLDAYLSLSKIREKEPIDQEELYHLFPMIINFVKNKDMYSLQKLNSAGFSEYFIDLRIEDKSLLDYAISQADDELILLLFNKHPDCLRPKISSIVDQLIAKNIERKELGRIIKTVTNTKHCFSETELLNKLDPVIMLYADQDDCNEIINILLEFKTHISADILKNKLREIFQSHHHLIYLQFLRKHYPDFLDEFLKESVMDSKESEGLTYQYMIFSEILKEDLKEEKSFLSEEDILLLNSCRSIYKKFFTRDAFVHPEELELKDFQHFSIHFPDLVESKLNKLISDLPKNKDFIREFYFFIPKNARLKIFNSVNFVRLVKSELFDIAGELLPFADLNLKIESSPLLCYAAECKNSAEFVKLLIQAGYKIDNVNYSNIPPIHLAIRENNLEVVRILYDSHPVDLLDDHGDTLLISASYRAKFEIVQFLLEKQLDVNKKNKEGDTPLSSCATFRYGNHHKIAQLLLIHGADPHVSLETKCLEKSETNAFIFLQLLYKYIKDNDINDACTLRCIEESKSPYDNTLKEIKTRINSLSSSHGFFQPHVPETYIALFSSLEKLCEELLKFSTLNKIKPAVEKPPLMFKIEGYDP